ncbi:PREDICTED: protein IQ-DOMAIN 32 [Tarenaya hassleriana]|uniref:protein IQ-DOMAIN 32 n=1 Tax=Tarenaya hassleriana TaxID=28532 RepID=UPI00053C74C9|nr:PREDICTED: protein IQ-DOMAIN 32 [Tarenaya hassleriana]
MGKSPSSCFRIITCGGGAGEPTAKDAGDLNSYENKSSPDKRGWSFRKKSGGHRGLNNSAVSETPVAIRTRETLESALLKSPSPDSNKVSEKPFTVQSTEDMSQLPVTYVSQPTTEEKTQFPVPQAVQPTEDKPVLSVARVEELLIHDRTELPVPVETRGTETEDEVNETEMETELHVKSKGTDAGDATVMEEDIGSEVCTQEPETGDVMVIKKENDEEFGEKIDESVIIIIQSVIRGFLARRNFLKHKKAIILQAAMRGHLVRRQAIGTLRCVQAIVKMQALVRARRSMNHRAHVSEISDSAEKLLQNMFARHLMGSGPKTKPINIKCDPAKPSSAWNWLERWMSVSSPEKTSKPDLGTEEQKSEKPCALACPEEVLSRDERVHSELEIETEKNLSGDEASEIEVHDVEIGSRVDKPRSLQEEMESTGEQPKNPLKRKVSNPSFIAAQSKFEELTSVSNKPMTMSYKDVVLGETETKTDKISSNELSTMEDVARNQLDGGFDHGIEKSESSALGIPDKNSETEAADSKNGITFSEKGTDDAKVTNIEVKDEVEDSVVLENKQKSVISTPDDKKKHQKTEKVNQAYTFSPEASSPMTIPESQATPSSVKSKKDGTRKSGSSQKRKPSKKTTSSPNHESGGSENVEQGPGKDQKSGRRRNSSGVDQEPRDDGKSSIPRFMRPTESARAKVQEQNSPRSSPDVHERDDSIKKRHSLPGSNGKQNSSSPRIQRSSTQTQQGTKERKWQR